MARIAQLMGLIAGILIGSGCHAWGAECDDLMPSDRAGDLPVRSIELNDLLRLRDVGSSSTSDLTSPILAVSPNGRRVAFQIRRVARSSNSYCLGMVVSDVEGQTPPVLIDSGGDFLRVSQSLLGVTDYPSGYTEVVTPKWSPDGLWVAFLKRSGAYTQVWRAKADGTGSKPVTQVDFDVEDFNWGRDPETIRITGRPGLAEVRRRLDAEGQAGFFYDSRFIPFAGNRPFPRDNVRSEAFDVSLENGQVTPVVSGADSHRLEGGIPPTPPSAIRAASGENGAVAWTELADANNVLSRPVLRVRTRPGVEQACTFAACGDEAVKVKDMWWLPGGRELIFLRESWNRSRASLFRWDTATGRVRKLLETEDVLLGCQLAIAQLVCAHEGSRRPRSLVRIDLRSAKLETVVDLNPEFAHIELGTVRRLSWTNRYGISNFGDLVLPPDAKPGKTYPLVVVQYETRGFLRGGTDDEYPIFLFAAHDIAVLSFQHPDSVMPVEGAKDWTEVNRLNYQNWTNRKNIQASVEAGIEAAAATGQIDISRLGITGLSEGASMVQWALLNTDMFRAAASSSCCEDFVTTISMSGPAGAEALYSVGYPHLTDADQSFWKPYSLMWNAARMNTPLLLQSADNEYLNGSESVAALQELNKPIDLYVFPDEYHVKWQPLHRRAVYQRNVDWFDFWLRGVEDSDPAKIAQYERWQDFRNALTPSSGAITGAR